MFSGVNIWRWNELECHLNMNNVRDWLEGKFRTNMVLLIWHLVNCCTVGTVLGGGAGSGLLGHPFEESWK